MKRKTQLSQPDYKIVIERNVPIYMSDGTLLRADVHRPDSNKKFPVLIERTPYSKEASSETAYGTAEFYASRGYVCVFQDVRGRFSSEGDFYPFRDDGLGKRKDGHDTVKWASEQSWSNGRIGTIGGSYSGATQYQMLSDPPPQLVTQFVRQSSSDYHNEWVYRSGALELGFNFSWTVRHTSTHAQKWAPSGKSQQYEKYMEYTFQHMRDLMRKLPLTDFKKLFDLSPWYQDWLNNPDYGSYWEAFNISRIHDQVNIPIYHLGGWYDCFLKGTIDNFNGMQQQAKTASARRNQKLLIGPWVHGPDSIGSSGCGEMSFGDNAKIGIFELRLEWFDFWLKGIQNSVPEMPPVKIFTMGSNRWQHFSKWPPQPTRPTPLFFRKRSSFTTDSLNDGNLSYSRPQNSEQGDVYKYDPSDPVPTTGGAHLWEPNGIMDQRPIEKRVLTYTSLPVETPVEITGNVKAVIFAKTTARDTDWVVKLTDVHPDGRSMLVCDGILRARYRKSRSKPELLNGETFEYLIDLWSISHTFLRGHRLRVLVTSSDFPRWDRNLNTGGINSHEKNRVVATNTIFHDVDRPSHILLPIM